MDNSLLKAQSFCTGHFFQFLERADEDTLTFIQECLSECEGRRSFEETLFEETLEVVRDLAIRALEENALDLAVERLAENLGSGQKTLQARLAKLSDERREADQQQVAFRIETAREMYRDYPELVTAAEMPEPWKEMLVLGLSTQGKVA